MRDREAAGGELGEQRLNIAQNCLAGRRIAHMAERHAALQALDGRFVGKVIADEAQPALGMEALAVEGDDAGRFLAAMLQRMEAEAVRAAASSWPYTPNTPHSSRSVSPSRSNSKSRFAADHHMVLSCGLV